MSGLELVFGALGVLAVASGLLAVTSPKVVHSALWLVVCLGSLAGVYLVLGAEIVALVQLLVYVGAVVVLVLFALMLTRAPIAASPDLDAGPAQRIAAAVAALALAGVLGGTLMVVAGDAVITVEADRGSAAGIGRAIFGGWVLPFELLSVLLLAALVAALAVSRDRAADSGGRRGESSSSTAPSAPTPSAARLSSGQLATTPSGAGSPGAEPAGATAIGATAIGTTAIGTTASGAIATGATTIGSTATTGTGATASGATGTGTGATASGATAMGAAATDAGTVGSEPSGAGAPDEPPASPRATRDAE